MGLLITVSFGLTHIQRAYIVVGFRVPNFHIFQLPVIIIYGWDNVMFLRARRAVIDPIM